MQHELHQSQNEVQPLKPVVLKAHFDGEHIVLDEPFELPTNVSLVVTILDPASIEDLHHPEREECAQLGAEHFAGAYGDDEPEYTLADLIS